MISDTISHHRSLIIPCLPCHFAALEHHASPVLWSEGMTLQCSGIRPTICRWIYPPWSGERSPFTVKNLFTAGANFCLTVVTRAWSDVQSCKVSVSLPFVLGLFSRHFLPIVETMLVREQYPLLSFVSSFHGKGRSLEGSNALGRSFFAFIFFTMLKAANDTTLKFKFDTNIHMLYMLYRWTYWKIFWLNQQKGNKNDIWWRRIFDYDLIRNSVWSHQNSC